MSYYIYKISGAGMDYYGSSKQDFCERKSQHKSQFKHFQKLGNGNKCSSYKILEATDDWIMSIIESNIETEQEALKREDWFINNNECVNIQNAIGLTGEALSGYKRNWTRWNRLKTGKTPLIPISLLTEDEKKAKKQERWRKWYEANKEITLQQQRDAYANKVFTEEDRQKERDRVKAYNEANKEKVNAHKKDYYEANKEILNAKNKAYYEANKEEQIAKQKSYYEANKERINEGRRKKHMYLLEAGCRKAF
jgi:hypothetical protein